MAKKNTVIIPGTMQNIGRQSQGRVVDEETQPKEQEAHQTPAVKPEPSEGMKAVAFIELVDKFTGTKGQGQGQAIWVPNEIKKDLERIRVNDKKNIPLRALAAAMITAFIKEHPEEIEKL